MALRHEDAKHLALAQRADGQRSRHRAIDAARESQDHPAALQVMSQEMTQALRNAVCFSARVDAKGIYAKLHMSIISGHRREQRELSPSPCLLKLRHYAYEKPDCQVDRRLARSVEPA